MSEDSMLMCLIAFVLGYLIARMIRGDGLVIEEEQECPTISQYYSKDTTKSPLMNATYIDGILNYCAKKTEDSKGWITNDDPPSQCQSSGYKNCSLNLGENICKQLLEQIPALSRHSQNKVAIEKAYKICDNNPSNSPIQFCTSRNQSNTNNDMCNGCTDGLLSMREIVENICKSKS